MPPWTFSSPDPDFPIWSCHQAGGFCDWCGGGNACCKPLGDQFHACWDGHKEGDSTLGWENSPFLWNHTWRSIIIIYCMRYKKNICIYIIMWVWIYPSKDSIYFRKAWFRRFSKGYLQFTFWRQMQTAYIPEGWTRQRPYRMSWRSKCNLAVEEKLQCLQMGKLGLVKYVNQLIQSDLCIPQLEVT